MDQKPSDRELLSRMFSDDCRAFEDIYNRYSKNMFLYAMNVFGKKDVCEDIVQNVFIDVWSRRKQVKIKNLKSYLFQSVKFQVFNHLRNRKISNEDLTRLNIIDYSMNISEKMECDELRKFIDKQVTRLPTRCQQIFVLSRYQHKPNKEIAMELGISNQAVKNQISKALNFIRQNLRTEEVVFFMFFVIKLTF